MLRAFVLAVGAVLVIVAVILHFLYGFPIGVPYLFWGILLIVAVLFERWKYGRVGGILVGDDWEATTEKFEDPSSGQLLEVWYNTKTGERRYVPISTTEPKA